MATVVAKGVLTGYTAKPELRTAVTVTAWLSVGVTAADGVLIAAWGDNSNSTGDNPNGATDFDVYTAPVYVLPPLGLASSPTNLVLSWPTNAVRFVLQENSDLNPAGWTNSAATPQVNGGQKQVAFDFTNSARFFRLMHQ